MIQYKFICIFFQFSLFFINQIHGHIHFYILQIFQFQNPIKGLTKQ